MAEMKSKTVAALGSLAVLIGAVPGLIGSALAIDQGQILILSNGKGKATGPRAAISQSGSGDQPGAVVIVPIDGEVRVIGLQAGLYTIQVSGSAEANAVKVEADGRLAFAGYQAARPGQRTDTAATGRRKPVDPIVRTWAEQVAFGGPCDEPRTCLNLADAIDLNSASAEEIAQRTGTAMQSAVRLVSLREKGGRFASIEDFIQRVCPVAPIDMSRGGIRVAQVTVLMPHSVSKPAIPGLQCAPRNGGQFSLYGRKQSYVGHVTLLR